MHRPMFRAALGAAALLCGTAAFAAPVTLDFETFDTSIAPSAPLLRDGDYFIKGNYFVNTQAQLAGSSNAIARLSTGSDANSCVNGSCPSGDLTRFLSLLGGGILHIGKLDLSAVSFTSLDAAAIPTSTTPAGSTVHLVIEADRADGSYASFMYDLTAGFQTITAATAATLLDGSGGLDSGTVTDLFFYTYTCSGSSCEYLKSGLAVDNILLDAPLATTVPEPSALLLLATGLAAAGSVRRRRP